MWDSTDGEGKEVGSTGAKVKVQRSLALEDPNVQASSSVCLFLVSFLCASHILKFTTSHLLP